MRNNRVGPSYCSTQEFVMKTSSNLEIKIESGSGSVVVSLIGDAGVAHADLLANALLRLSASHPPRVIFDLSRLEFISSITMGELVEFQRGLKRHDSRVTLIAPRPNVLAALQRARLDSIFEICNDPTDVAIH
jgi:anti-anti-sigma factor